MESDIIRDLGDGLVLRRSRPSDVDALPELNGTVFRPREATGPNPFMATWTRDLLTLPHPNVKPEDFLLVEEKETGRVISSLVQIPQTWTYAGIPFGVGRPEMVSTLPEYRNRGLVRALFQAFHNWSAEQGHHAQAITGIAYFYRQFGYEMTITLGGGRGGPKTGAPKLKEGESEAFGFRSATLSDIPFLSELYDGVVKRSLVACQRDEAHWRHELIGRSRESATRGEITIVETAAGEPVGLLMTDAFFHGTTFRLHGYELRPGVSYAAVTPSVLRYLVRTGEECFARNAELYLWRGKARQDIEFTTIAFDMGAEHPAYQLVQQAMPKVDKPYAWYIRVPDVAAFLRLVAPALEARLAQSALAGHTGEVKLNFYRTGLQLTFERGKLASVEDWKPGPDEWGTPSFPDLTFLQLLFGYRTLEELEHAFPDVGAGDDTSRALLGVLFPKRSSDVWPVA